MKHHPFQQEAAVVTFSTVQGKGQLREEWKSLSQWYRAGFSLSRPGSGCAVYQGS